MQNLGIALFLITATSSAFTFGGVSRLLGIKQRDPICDLPGDPSLTIVTNVKVTDKPSLLTKCSAIVSRCLAKPESFVAIAVIDETHMLWGGSNDPCAICTLNSLGAINQENNGKVQAQLTEVLAEFDILPTRIYTTFNDIARSNMGYDGRTFAG